MLADRRTEKLLENEEALDKVRKNFYHLWKPLMEAPRKQMAGQGPRRRAPASRRGPRAPQCGTERPQELSEPRERSWWQ